MPGSVLVAATLTAAVSNTVAVLVPVTVKLVAVGITVVTRTATPSTIALAGIWIVVAEVAAAAIVVTSVNDWIVTASLCAAVAATLGAAALVENVPVVPLTAELNVPVVPLTAPLEVKEVTESAAARETELSMGPEAELRDSEVAAVPLV